MEPGEVRSVKLDFDVEIRDGAVVRVAFGDGRGDAEVLGQLRDYVAGRRTGFELKLAPEGTELQRRVWDEVARIPYGATLSYGELAARLGLPAGAARAVGAAVGANPLLVVIPCHRVVGAKGELTGYAGGVERKRALLALERGQGALF